MPSPLGHALGGIAAGWDAAPTRTRVTTAILAAVAIAPDLDLVFGTHREASHSLGAAALAGIAALAFATARPWPARLRWAAAVTIAWGSHVLLDWLSNDTRPPIGVMALWPFTHEYYKSAIEIFPPVSRRYWESRFWLYNLRAVVAECLILAPITVLVVWRRRRAR
jgi:inner membrane protein